MELGGVNEEGRRPRLPKSLGDASTFAEGPGRTGHPGRAASAPGMGIPHALRPGGPVQLGSRLGDGRTTVEPLERSLRDEVWFRLRTGG